MSQLRISCDSAPLHLTSRIPFTTYTQTSDHVPTLKELDNVTTSHLAGQNVSKRWEGVIKCLVINGFIQVLDEDIPNPWFPQGRVPLGPHDANGFPFDHIKIHGVKSSLSCKRRFLVLVKKIKVSMGWVILFSEFYWELRYYQKWSMIFNSMFQGSLQHSH